MHLPFRRNSDHLQIHTPLTAVEQGRRTIRILDRVLTQMDDAASMGAVIRARKSAIETLRLLYRLVDQDSEHARFLDLAPELESIEQQLSDVVLPTAARRELARLYCAASELALVFEHGDRVKPAHDDHFATVSALPLKVSTALLYQTRRMLLPAERMAIGAVRRGPQGSMLEAVFDVTGVATATHVDADPDKLMRAFIDIDNAGGIYAFWAHTQPGIGASATMPSPEDRDVFRRRLCEGDSHAMIAAIFSETHVRFLRASPDLQLVGAGSAVEIIGPGLRLDTTKRLFNGQGDTYEFVT